jgi:hypothetical protein
MESQNIRNSRHQKRSIRLMKSVLASEADGLGVTGCEPSEQHCLALEIADGI